MDVLIPAALGGAITRDNAEAIKAKIVVEAANSPVTPRADEILRGRGIHVIPDILVNAGGVIVSYFEWVQNLQQFQWGLPKVNGELEEKLLAACQAVFSRSEQENITLRTAAYVEALHRVAESTRQRF